MPYRLATPLCFRTESEFGGTPTRHFSSFRAAKKRKEEGKMDRGRLL